MLSFKNIIDSKYSIFILSFVTLIIALFAWLFPKYEYREIKIGLMSNIQIINISNNIDKKDLTFYFKDKPIENLTYIKIRFKNTGTQPFTKENFIKDIQILLPKEMEIIDYKEIPQGIINIKKIDNNILSFNSELINPKDIIDLELLVNNRDTPLLLSNIKIDGRIFGVNTLQIKDQQLLSEEEEKSQITGIILMFFIFLPLVLLPLSGMFYLENRNIKKTILFALTLWITISIIIIPLLILKNFFPAVQFIFNK